MKQLIKAAEGQRASAVKDNGLVRAGLGAVDVKAAALPQISLNCACRTEPSEAFCLLLPLNH